MNGYSLRAMQAVTLLLVGVPLLACVNLPWYLTDGAATTTLPRWTCPTPTPLPFGEAGPIKSTIGATPEPTTGAAAETPVYYEQWEQEDFDGNGAPFPAPTPYTKLGTSFFLGQIVNLAPDLDVQADVVATSMVQNGLRLYTADLEWHNRGEPIDVSLARQVVISTIRQPDGRQISGEGWTWTATAAQVAGQSANDTMLRDRIEPGTTQTKIPILAPDGTAMTLDLQLDLPGTRSALGALRVQWFRAIDPQCEALGVVSANYAEPPLEAAPPPEPGAASDVVAFAESQIGRPYCWGGKGWDNCDGYGGGPRQVTPSCRAQGGSPCWDCSGLMWGAYNAVGTTIGHGTANQKNEPLVWRAGDTRDPASVVQPGDLLLFTGANANGRPAGSITHVGMYAGNGVMIHAANYPDGVIRTPNIFTNRYYKPLLAVITRPTK